MSVISDKIASANAEADAAIGRVQEDVATLQAKIAQLEAEASTPADLAELDSLKDKLAALDPTKPDVLPTE